MDPTSAADLATYVSQLDERVAGIEADVRAALGVGAGETIADVALVGHHLVRGEKLLELYLVTDRTLSIYQRSTEGRRLCVTVSLERVSRVSWSSDGETASLTLELDAERTTTTTEAEYMDGPVADEGGEVGRRRGIERATATTVRTGYVLQASGDQVEVLQAFHGRMVRALAQ